MVKQSTYFFAILLLLVCFSLGVSSQQTTAKKEDRSSVIIRNADEARNLDYEGGSGQRLLGNVIIEQEKNGVVITCDSAYLYTSDSLDLFSQIEMFQGASTIRCDKMTYDGGWARVRGHVVRMHKDNMTLLTQHFDYNIEQELGIYFNGGTVDRNGELLESDRGYYYAQPDLFMFGGNVALKNEEYTIASDSMQYHMSTEDMLFLGPTKIWKDDNFLSANYGWQKKTIDETFFTNNVYICTPDKELWADSLYYYQSEERGLLYGNIQAVDTVQSSIAFGDEGRFFNNPEFAEIYKNPAIAYYSKRESKNSDEIAAPEQEPMDNLDGMQPPMSRMDNSLPIIDTLFIVADTIRSVAYPNPALYISQPDLTAEQVPDMVTVEIDTPVAKAQPVDSVYRQMYAFPNVRAYRYDVQAVCDSLVFNTRDSVAKMFINPVIWSDTTQISADSIYFRMKDGALDVADFYSSPFIAIKEDTTRFTQLKGRSMRAFFLNNAMDKLDTYGNAQNIYYQRDKGVIENASVSQSSNMTIYFRESRVFRVKYEYQVESKLYPLNMLPEEDKELKGLNWQESRRPQSREELFTRNVQPSRREQVLRYSPPTFSITSRLLELEKKSWVHGRAQEELSMPSVR